MDINALRVACAKLNTLPKNYSWHGIKRLKLPNLTVLAKSDDILEEQVEAMLKSSVVLDMLEKLHMQSSRATLGHASHRDIFAYLTASRSELAQIHSELPLRGLPPDRSKPSCP